MESYTGMNAISGDMRGLRRASMAGHVTLGDSDVRRWSAEAEGGGAAKLSANWKADVSLAAQVRGAPLFFTLNNHNQTGPGAGITRII